MPNFVILKELFRMKYSFKTLVLILLISLQASAQEIAKTIPDFTFYTLRGDSFSNKDLTNGKILFFVFFDSDCDHCQHAVAAINKNQKEFKNVAVYLISLDDQQKINRFMNSYGPALIAGKNVTILQDVKNDFLPKFKPRKYPSMFLFAKDGKLIVYEDNPENVFRIVKQIQTFNK